MQPSSEDRTLLLKMQEGDEKAFEKLFRKYYEAAYHFAFRFVLQKEQAEEIAQEVFTRLWEKRSDLNIHASFKSYLYTAVRNGCLNFLKSKYHQTDQFGSLPEKIHPNTRTTEQQLEAGELEKLVQDVIARLPEKCRMIFNLSRQAGMTYQEIASELGISKETVKSQIKIALQRLREFLEKYWK